MTAKKDFSKKPETDLAKAYGMVPPQNIEAEESVLGSIMTEADAINVVIPILTPECFYKPANRTIFQHCLALFGKREPIDLLSITKELRANSKLEEIGGAFYLVELTQKAGSFTNIEFHARYVQECWIKRELIKIGSHCSKEGFNPGTDVFELMDATMSMLLLLRQPTMKRASLSLSTLIRQALLRYAELSNRPEGVMTGIPSGLDNLDRLTQGWQKSDFIIIAARPGMGKTAMVVTAAINAININPKKKGFLASLEMSSAQLIDRIVSSETEVELKKLRSRPTSHDLIKVHQKIDHLLNDGLYIDDTPALSITDLRAKVLSFVSEHISEADGEELGFVMVDYLQLMRGSEVDKRGGNNREQEVGSISRGLKALAKELNVPVIALSQLSRATETRGGDKRPGLADLRESGSIEQDADMVLFLYRPEYYGILVDEENNSTKGTAEIIIAKHRNGSLDTAHVRFVGELTKFTNLNDEWAQPVARDFAPDHATSAATVKYREPKEDAKTDVFRQSQPSSLLDMIPPPPNANKGSF